MKKNLITDFLPSIKVNEFEKEYLEMPVFDKKFVLKKNIIYLKEWNNYKKKLNDIKKNYKLYDHFLNELTIFLNDYHKKSYSKRFWAIILGQWLFKFISSMSVKWKLVNSLKKKKI